MPEVITVEIDVFARVEHVNGGRVAKHMDVATIGWEAGLGRVGAGRDPGSPLLEFSLKTNEERFASVSPASEVLA